MKNIGFAAVALLLASGVSLAAAGGGEGCCASQAKSVAKAPLAEKADGILAKWTEMSKNPKNLSEADQASMSTAMASLKEICPIGKSMPETVSYITKSLKLANGLEKECETSCSKDSAMVASIPAEMKGMMKERAMLLGKSEQLLGTAFAAMGMVEKSGCCKAQASVDPKAEKKGCCSGEEKNCSSNTNCFATLGKKADALLTNWDGVPARFTALSAEEKTRFHSAMATVKKLGAPMETFGETLVVAKEMLDRVNSIDATMEKSCSAESAEKQACATKSEEMKAMKAAFAARSANLKKTADLLDRMIKSMSPGPNNPIFAQQ